mmetsp:Transcript_43857/g.126706  ORF Transcript_43857/g.126706 Transcript_43857/m.126706 type:complete len:208 (+) Transcript_43857:327-950(+)
MQDRREDHGRRALAHLLPHLRMLLCMHTAVHGVAKPTVSDGDAPIRRQTDGQSKAHLGELLRRKCSHRPQASRLASYHFWCVVVSFATALLHQSLRQAVCASGLPSTKKRMHRLDVRLQAGLHFVLLPAPQIPLCPQDVVLLRGSPRQEVEGVAIRLQRADLRMQRRRHGLLKPFVHLRPIASSGGLPEDGIESCNVSLEALGAVHF